MDNHTLHRDFLQKGTDGYVIISRFYSRYADVLSRANFTDINDVVHEVFLSLSKSDVRDVRDLEHYIMRAIKLQCWSLLDKAIKVKAIGSKTEPIDRDEDQQKIHYNRTTNQAEQLTALEGNELLIQLSLFKLRLTMQELRLLNFLIDEADRSEIAKTTGMNLNTLDTNIRRLRIKLAEYLKSLGYTHSGLERFV
ncbi:MAG: hypothetical protein WDA22_13370 [Bacteroidota bacterium]